jgi:hypothetical protein
MRKPKDTGIVKVEAKLVPPDARLRRVANGYQIDLRGGGDVYQRTSSLGDAFEDVYVFETFASLVVWLRKRFAHRVVAASDAP